MRRVAVAVAVATVAATGLAVGVTREEFLGSHASGCIQIRGGTNVVDDVVASSSHSGVLYASTRRGTLYVTTDAGRRWFIRNRRTPGPVVAAIGTRQDVLLAPGLRGLFASTDGGRTWTPWSCEIEVAAVSASRNGSTVYVAGGEDLSTGKGGGLYETSDAGKTWIRHADLPGNNLNVNAVLVDPTNANVVYAATEAGGILRSSDGARQFQWRTIGVPSPGLPHGQQVTTLSLSPAAPTVVWAGTRLDGVWRGGQGGKFWSISGLKRQWVDYLAADPQIARRVYAGTSGVATTGARPSTPAHSSPGTFIKRDIHAWRAIEVLPGEWGVDVSIRTGMLYAWRNRTIVASRDHGLNWIRLR